MLWVNYDAWRRGNPLEGYSYAMAHHRRKGQKPRSAGVGKRSRRREKRKPEPRVEQNICGGTRSAVVWGMAKMKMTVRINCCACDQIVLVAVKSPVRVNSVLCKACTDMEERVARNVTQSLGVEWPRASELGGISDCSDVVRTWARR